jgi:hypothetical protein
MQTDGIVESKILSESKRSSELSPATGFYEEHPISKGDLRPETDFLNTAKH